MAIESSNKSTSSSPITSGTAKDADIFENTLRPKVLDEYIGQSQLKENLKVFLAAAKKREEPLEHTLLYGPPGLGKTTMASIIAHEMGGKLKVTSAPAIQKQGDLAAVVSNLKPGDVLFIDEIHRMNSNVEEILYSAMEDYVLDIMIGKGPSARTMRLSIPQFTLIGATTKFSMLSSPLRDRFGHIFKLNYYTSDEIKQIIHRSAGILEYQVEEKACETLAKCARKTPRIANRLLKRVRDFADIDDKPHNMIDLEVTQRAMRALGIDERGLNRTDIDLLNILITKFKGGPVGLNTLSAATGEDAGTIEDVYEPFLIQLGMLDRSPRGRIATENAYQHLGISTSKKSPQDQLSFG